MTSPWQGRMNYSLYSMLNTGAVTFLYRPQATASRKELIMFILSVYTQTIRVLADKIPNQCKRHREILLAGTSTLAPSAAPSPSKLSL